MNVGRPGRPLWFGSPVRRRQVFKQMEHHNLKRLLERGLCVTVNSDDPALEVM